MKRLAAVALCLILSTAALADEVEDALAAALEAYQAGDVSAAVEELDYAKTLIEQLKAEGLKAFLPEPPESWSREISDTSANAAFFGGGVVAEATYRREARDITLQIMAGGPMVTALATMLGNSALMGAMGKVKRLKRQKYVITHEREIQALVDGRVLVQITGSAQVDEKEAILTLIDFAGLKEF